MVGNALVKVMDGAFSESLQGVVLGKEANLQVTDADRDISDKADSIKVKIQVLRQKTPLEIEEEKAKLIAEGVVPEGNPAEQSPPHPVCLEPQSKILLKRSWRWILSRLWIRWRSL